MQLLQTKIHEMELTDTTIDLFLDPTNYLDELYTDLPSYSSTEFTLEMKIIFHELIMKGRIICEVPVRAKTIKDEQLQ